MNDRPVQPPDPTRRRFFRQFAGDVVTSVGSVLGAAQVLQQQSAEAARELLGPEGQGAAGAALADAAAPPREQPAAGAGFRAAFRWDGDVCHVVDQRRLPDTLVDIEVRGAGDGVSAINDLAIVGAAAQAQLAAVTLAIIAARTLTHRPFARRATLRGAGNAFRTARPGSAAMAATVARMLDVADALGLEAEPTAVAEALRAEAEAIVSEATAAHGALADNLVGALPGTGDGPLRVLTIGSTGTMGGGQCGTVLTALLAVHHTTRPIHVLVAETRPSFEGSRVAAWELREAGASYAVVTDGAAAGLVAGGEADAVVVAADRVTAGGDVVATAGSYPLALAAAAAGVPFLVGAPLIAVDLATAEGSDATIEEGRAGRVLEAAGTRVAPPGSLVRSPAQDLTPSSLVSAIVTEAGVVRPPFGPGLAAQVAAARPRVTAAAGNAAAAEAQVAPTPEGAS